MTNPNATKSLTDLVAGEKFQTPRGEWVTFDYVTSEPGDRVCVHYRDSSSYRRSRIYSFGATVPVREEAS